jgi:Putative F0F1-ATPase subunit Ca2+/Mg2+ transporter
MSNLKKPKKQLKNYLQFTGLAFQMGITFYLAAYFGRKLDAHFQLHKNYFTFGFIIVAMILSLYLITKQLKYLNKK